MRASGGTPGVLSVVEAGFARRRAPVAALADQAGVIADTCRAMAERFSRGGRLLVFGSGAAAADSAHVAVEFVHPVIVGKRALPALSLACDLATVTGLAASRGIEEVYAQQVRVLSASADIALGVSAGPDRAVRRGLLEARSRGLLTIALTGPFAAGGEGADHTISIPSGDAMVVKEGQVTAYHVLWELVHAFLDDAAAGPDRAADGGLGDLYPFLYAKAADGDQADLVAGVERSTRDKVAEVVELRDAVGRSQAPGIAAAAAAMAQRFAAGGTLLAFGNGGSSTDAAGVAHSFLCGAARALPALCLTSEAAVLTALTNDVAFEVVFARQIRAFGGPHDIAFGLSTSGGSANVLRGLEEAKAMGLLTIGLAGYDGGAMGRLEALDHLFAVPSSSVHRVQEVQTTIYSVLWESVQELLAA